MLEGKRAEAAPLWYVLTTAKLCNAQMQAKGHNQIGIRDSNESSSALYKTPNPATIYPTVPNQPQSWSNTSVTLPLVV